MRPVIFLWLVAFFVLFSLTPTFYELSRSDSIQPYRSFELVHNFPTDYNFYLSRIRQGIEGSATLVEKYTSEPHRGSFIHVFYLSLGWLGRWVRVPWERAGDVYHVARIVLGMTLLFLIAEFAKRSFSKDQSRSGKEFFGDARRDKAGAAEVTNENFDLPSVSLAKSTFPTPSSHSRSQSEAKQNFVSSPQRLTHGFSLVIGHWSLVIPASLVAFLLAVTASTWPKLVYFNDGWRFGGYMAWWSVMDSLQRITFIPHLLAGQALTLFLIMALSDEQVLPRGSSWIFLGLAGFGLGIIFPPGLVFVYATVVILVVLESVFLRSILARALKHFWPRGIFILLSIPALIYLQLMTSFYPWKRLAEFDIISPLPFDYLEYAKAVGPILPLGIGGLVVALWSREKRMMASVAWVVAWLGLLGIFRFVPQQSPLRFSEMIPHVPLGILATYVFYIMNERLHSQKNFLAPLLAGLFSTKKQTIDQVGGKSRSAGVELGKRSSKIFLLTALFFHRIFSAPHNGPHRRPLSAFSLITYHLSLITPMALVAIGLGVMYSSFLWQRDFIDHKMRAAYPLVPTGSYVMYPLKDFIAAIRFLQDATSRDTVILSETTAGNYIPVYSGNTVYVGHANTVGKEEKEKAAKAFFSGRMKPAEADSWLARENLRYIFYGPQEREDGGIGDVAIIYPFLESIYKNNFVTIYRVK